MSAEKPENPPAFPTTYYATDSAGMDRPDTLFGMTLRDYFAGQALVALGDHGAVTSRGIPWLAEHAYMVADAMLAERSRS